jgi:glycosyltransferase involved in cell wall biosynthesis
MTQQTNSPDFSVIVLCYREGKRARLFATELERVLQHTGIIYELVLVGNYWKGTYDETPDIVRELARRNSRIRAVAFPKQKGQGMGWDARMGMDAAQGEIIAFVDGDGQIPAEDVVRGYKKLRAEHLDFCKAVRITRQDGIMRKIISIFYNILMRALFPGIDMRDVNGKPKIITRQAYSRMNLTSNGWFLDGEMVIRANELGLRRGIISIIFRKNTYRSSHVHVRMIIDFIKDIILYRLRHL